MDFYLFDVNPGGRSVRFPVAPEELTVTADAKTQTFDVLALGEITLPRGRTATRYSWSGFLPGQARMGQPWMAHWRPPRDVLRDLELWHARNTILRLTVTETELNNDCFIQSLEHAWRGGYGDLEYSLVLVEYRPLVVSIDGEDAPQGRDAPPVATTYTVREGDTLWAIAKRAYDDGSRWMEIYEANRSPIGPDPDIIVVGVELRIPGGTVPASPATSAYVAPQAAPAPAPAPAPQGRIGGPRWFIPDDEP